MKYLNLFLITVAIFCTSIASSSTVYFTSQHGGLDATESPGPYTTAMIFFSDNNVFTPLAAADDQCGKYWDGSAWQTSSTFASAMDSGQVLAIDATGKVYNTILTFFTSAVADGTVFTSISAYKEDADDDGECFQNAKIYFKYSATLP